MTAKEWLQSRQTKLGEVLYSDLEAYAAHVARPLVKALEVPRRN